jgi:hypothetical protein
MNTKLLGVLGCAIAALFLAGEAQASPAARLVYVRSPDAMTCPDEEALRRAVATRFGYVPFFPWAHATMVVQLWRDRGRLRARIQLADSKGTESGTRELASDQPGCAELFEATALAISIALDTPPADEPAPPPTSAAVSPQGAPSGSPEASSPASGERSSPTESPPLATPAPPASASPQAAGTQPPSPRTESTLSAGLEGIVRQDVAPDVAPGVGAFARYRSGAFSIAVEAQADFSFPFSVKGSGQVQSAAWIGGVAPCAHLGPAFACVVGEVGALQAWRSGVTGASRANGVLVESVARLGLEWPLSSRLALRVRGDAGVNWLTDRIDVGGANWPVPLPSLALAAGVVVRFR